MRVEDDLTSFLSTDERQPQNLSAGKTSPGWGATRMDGCPPEFEACSTSTTYRCRTVPMYSELLGRPMSIKSGQVRSGQVKSGQIRSGEVPLLTQDEGFLSLPFQ